MGISLSIQVIFIIHNSISKKTKKSLTFRTLLSKSRPKLEHISNISFHRPVHVSSLIKMNARVIYTEANYMEIVVINETFDASTGQNSTTNVFYYTYSIRDHVNQVIPKTYHEAMWYLDGRRKFNTAMGLDGAEQHFPVLNSLENVK